MPAKKSSKARTAKASAKTKKTTARKPASKSKKTAAPKAGTREEHYADLRRVALANALSRLR